MATISGRVIFDRNRSASISSGDSGIANIPVVLQNIATNARLTVLTDSNGNYSFINVPDGNYRIVESFGAAGGLPNAGRAQQCGKRQHTAGRQPAYYRCKQSPAGSTNLDSVTRIRFL